MRKANSLIGWGHIINLVWDEKAQNGLVLGVQPTGYTVFLVSRPFTDTGKLSEFRFTDMAC